GVGGCPAIGAGIISPAGVRNIRGARQISAPDNHLTPRPHCCVILPTIGRAGGAGSGPSVSARIVSPAGLQKVSAPNDHHITAPHCSVTISGSGCVGSRGGD